MTRIAIPQPKPIVDRAIAELVASGTLVPESLRNQPNGFAGLDGDGNLLGTVTHRRGTASEINTIVLADGELAFVTDLNEIRRGNGSTAGGVLAGFGRALYGATGVLSSTTQANPASIPVATGNVFRVFGFADFNGDAESQSNFLFSLLRVNCGFSSTALPSGRTWVRRSQWSHPADSSIYSQFTRSASTGGAIAFQPNDLTKQSAYVEFDITVAIGSLLASPATLSVGPSLRLSTSITTITCAWHVFVERLK